MDIKELERMSTEGLEWYLNKYKDTLSKEDEETINKLWRRKLAKECGCERLLEEPLKSLLIQALDMREAGRKEDKNIEIAKKKLGQS
jgi:uncharacterized protein YihD (DUF1040 family)